MKGDNLLSPLCLSVKILQMAYLLSDYMFNQGLGFGKYFMRKYFLMRTRSILLHIKRDYEAEKDENVIEEVL